MSTIIVNSNDFSPAENMIFTKPKANNAGGKSVGILNSRSKKSLLIQTPLMMNWGVNVYDNANNSKYLRQGITQVVGLRNTLGGA